MIIMSLVLALQRIIPVIGVFLAGALAILVIYMLKKEVKFINRQLLIAMKDLHVQLDSEGYLWSKRVQSRLRADQIRTEFRKSGFHSVDVNKYSIVAHKNYLKDFGSEDLTYNQIIKALKEDS